MTGANYLFECLGFRVCVFWICGSGYRDLLFLGLAIVGMWAVYGSERV